MKILICGDRIDNKVTVLHSIKVRKDLIDFFDLECSDFAFMELYDRKGNVDQLILHMIAKIYRYKKHRNLPKYILKPIEDAESKVIPFLLEMDRELIIDVSEF